MDLDFLIEKLEETGFPVAYSHFNKNNPPKLPYIAVTMGASSNLFADDKVYHPINSYQVELCYEKKNPQQEKVLTDKFDELEIAWEKTSEEYINDDGVYSNFYEFEG